MSDDDLSEVWARSLADLPELYQRYVDASLRTPGRPNLAVVIDSQGRELSSMPHIGPPNETEPMHTAITLPMAAAS